MLAILVRELVVVARQRAVAVGSLVVAVLLAAFVLLWPHGVPLARGMNVYEQTRALAAVLFGLVLPWTCARAASPERGDAFVLLSALIGARPAAMVVAKAVAHGAGLALVVVSALPALVMAQQAAAISVSAPAGDVVALIGIALLVSGVTTACGLIVAARLAAWLTATAVGAAMLVFTWRLIPALPFAGLSSALAGVAVTLAAAAWGNSSLIYLRGQDA